MPEAITKFDIRDHIRTPEDRAAYVEAALETDDLNFIALALRDIDTASDGTDLANEIVERPDSLRTALALKS